MARSAGAKSPSRRMACASSIRVPSFRCQVSGLWQNWHRRKQPDMKSMSRTPGPSTVEPVS